MGTMSIYVMSDVHGCYKEYMELLEKIKFSEDDTLYILGDAMDRGPEPIKVILDIMKRENVTYILGNHDYYFYETMIKANKVMNGECSDEIFSDQELKDSLSWLGREGGRVTYDQFFKLPNEERLKILDFIHNAILYETIYLDDKEYILMHAGGFKEENLPVELYPLSCLLSKRASYSKRYFTDNLNTYLITGHTPTPLIREDKQVLVYEGNGHIAIDCGCVFGGSLAAYCLDIGVATYVKSKIE